MPMVSIVTPAFNAESFLPRFFEVIQTQTYRDFEVIIVDDTSGDRTREIIHAHMDDPRIRLISLPENRGAAGARNAGLQQASGRYLCFLDVDDAWQPEKLQRQVEFMEAKGCALSYMDYVRVDERGRLLSEVTAPPSVDFEAMLKSNRIGNLTAMVRRDTIEGIVFKRIGHEDYVFWLEALRRTGTAHKVPAPADLCFYTVRGGSLSSNKLKAAGWQWRIYRSTLGIGLLRSLWYMAHYIGISVAKRM